MSRVRGSIPFSSNYEATTNKPMDARMLVPTYGDLLENSNWVTSKNAPCCFNGMLVAVADMHDTSRNGLYMLFDPTNNRRPNVTIEENWIKIGETSDIADFVRRIETIEQSVAELSSDVSSLDARLTTLESEDRTHTYGYRKDFPAEGIPNHIYRAEDQGRSYIYSVNQYLPIGDTIYEYWDLDGDDEPDVRVINGGSAD